MTQRLYVGTRKGLFTWSRGSQGWQMDELTFRGEPVTMLLPHPGSGGLFAVLTLGHFGTKLRRRATGSDEWQELSAPSYPEGAQVNAGPPTGEQPPKTKPASLSEIWSLEAGGPDQPDVLWAGTIPGGLFRSADSGQSWQLVESLWNRPERWRWFGGGKDDPGIHSILVDPRDSRRVGLGISCGGYWHTDDGGGTWQCRGEGLVADYLPPELAGDPTTQDPHRVARCASAPDCLWMQHHNGIFVSDNDGQNWRRVETARPAAFGFAVSVHPHDPRTAWFVPATVDQCRVPVENRFVVSRTRDGGKTFEVLDRGLPQEPAFDIVWRHAMDVDSRGETLAVGSTTGGLWVSENGGDSWQCLSHTLPPIYTTRFAAN